MRTIPLDLEEEGGVARNQFEAHDTDGEQQPKQPRSQNYFLGTFGAQEERLSAELGADFSALQQ